MSLFRNRQNENHKPNFDPNLFSQYGNVHEPKKNRWNFLQRDENGKFCCITCPKSYKNKKHLIYHLKYECEKEPSFFCNHCPFKTKHKSSLKTHEIIKHTDFLNGSLTRPAVNDLEYL